MKGRYHSQKPLTGLHPMNKATRETIRHMAGREYLLDQAEFALRNAIEYAGRYPLPREHNWDTLGEALVKYLDKMVPHTPRRQYLKDNPDGEYYVDWGRIARFLVRAVRERHAAQGMWLRDKWRTRNLYRGKEWKYRQAR